MFGLNYDERQIEALNTITSNSIYQQYFSNIDPNIFLAQIMTESPSLCATCQNPQGFYGLGVNQTDLEQAYKQGYIQSPTPTLQNEIDTLFGFYKNYVDEGYCHPNDVACLINRYGTGYNNVMRTYKHITGNNTFLKYDPLQNFSEDTTQFLSHPLQSVKNAVETPIKFVESLVLPVAFVIFAIVLIIIAVLIYRSDYAIKY